MILGHLPGLSDASYYVEEKPVWKKNPYNRYLVESAQNNAIDMAVQYDNSFTKKCSEIIRTKAHFFCGLSNIQNVVVIGHSLSPVDWDYFVKIRDSFPNNKNVNVFRTDKISVKFYENDDSEILKPIPKERYLAASEDQVWKVNTVEKLITILKEGQINYQLEVHAPVSRAVFVNQAKQLLMHIGGYESVIYLFERRDDTWEFVNELLPVNGHYIMNNRLNNIYVDETSIRFVYNNRVYKYSIKSGLLEGNMAIRNARFNSYEGVDVYRQLRIH